MLSERELSNWEAAGFDYDEAEKWLALGFPIYLAFYARYVTFYLDEAKRWLGKGFTPEGALAWWDAGFNSEDAARWSKEGYSPYEAAEIRGMMKDDR